MATVEVQHGDQRPPGEAEPMIVIDKDKRTITVDDEGGQRVLPYASAEA